MCYYRIYSRNLSAYFSKSYLKNSKVIQGTLLVELFFQPVTKVTNKNLK